MIEGTPFIREAKFYGVKDLAYRAGVSAEFFRTWRICFDNAATTIYLQPETQKAIRLKNIGSEFWCELTARSFHSVWVPWMDPPAKSIEAVSFSILKFFMATTSSVWHAPSEFTLSG